MLVKVGDRWHGVEPGRPVMVVLTDEQKDLIARMPGNRFAMFDDEDPTTREERLAWMEDGPDAAG